MIKKIAVITIVLFVAYNLFLQLFGTSWKTQPQADYDLNVSKAQTYLLESGRFQTAILGSSLANRLDRNVFPSSCCFLTFSGMGPFEGLEILKINSDSLQFIFVETNSIYRELNEAFVKDAVSPFFRKTYKILPSTLKSNKPTSLLFSPLAYCVYGVRNKLMQAKPTSSNHVVSTDKKLATLAEPKDLRSQVSATHMGFIASEYARPFDEGILDRRLALLEQYVTYFEEQGIKVLFFEMPIRSDLRNLQRSVVIRESVKKLFSPKEYDIIFPPDSMQIISNDGIHLSGSSVTLFSEYLRDRVRELTQF